MSHLRERREIGLNLLVYAIRFKIKLKNTMAIEFTNRKGKTYYIKARKTKTGKTTYTLTKSKSIDCVDKIPLNYEVYEKPENGQMVLRKKIPSKFTLQDLHIIKTSLERNDTLSGFKLDIRGNELIIYTSEEQELGSLLESFSPFLKYKREQLRNMFMSYSAMMKVLIMDEDALGKYVIQRYCFRGSIDDWITIGISEDLKTVIDKYSYHLGKESFFELSYNFGE